MKHKKIVSNLKKTYNCWMIGLRYHIKVRTVIFRRRKLIRSKVKGKTVLKDKVKIPNGLQPTVEQQARHDADRAGDLQYTDNPYASGGAKFGFDCSIGRAQVGSRAIVPPTKVVDEDVSTQAGLRGRRGNGGRRPYVRRSNYPFQPGSRFTGHLGYQGV